MGLAAYRPILQTPGLKGLMAASTVARLPVGFETLGIVLLVRAATGSFALAGAAAAAMFAIAALTAAPLGRMVDRFGQRRVLVPTATWNAAALVTLGVAGSLDAPGGALITLAALTGVLPPISSCQRTILASLYSGSQLQSAYALESIVQEAVFTGGPLIATIAVVVAGPPAALYAAAALSLIGSLWFTQTRLSKAWRGVHADRRGGGAMRTPGVRLLFVFAILAAISFGGFEVAVTAFAREEGSPNAAGLFLALWAIGSAVGGLLYGARTWRHAPDIQIGRVALVCAAGFLPAAAAPNLWALAPMCVIAGLAIAPLLSLVYTLIGELAPVGMVTEAFAWLNVAFPIGIGAGAALSGVVADGPGARTAMALTCIGVGLGALVVFRGHRYLGPPGVSRSPPVTGSIELGSR
jgi:MFS family permease